MHKAPVTLSSAIDLRSKCSPITDSGRLCISTGNALVGTLKFLEIKDNISFIDLSRMFIYYNARDLEHSVHFDQGAQIRDGIKTLVKQGVCSEKCWPYVISQFAVKPPDSFPKKR